MGLLTIPVHEEYGIYRRGLAPDGIIHFIDTSEGMNNELDTTIINNGFVTIPEGATIVRVTRASVEYILSLKANMGVDITINRSL